ncbi:MAG: DNA polymerase I [Chloroflexota bacterium]
MARKAIFIDGNSLINRAYFAVRPLTNSQGQMTNAVYGFVTMLLRLLREEKPDYLAVAFDKSKINFRHSEYQAYKANRTGMPDQLASQMPLLKDVLRAFRIPIYEIDGYEADDVLGTLARQTATSDLTVLILTGDRDALQLIDDRTNVLFTLKGISDLKRYDAAALRADFDLAPAQIIDLKALMGDKSDNIPGIPGVGEKTALKLLHDFGSVDSVLDHADEVAGERLKALLREHADAARLSKRLATIKCDVPIAVDIDAAAVDEPDYPELLRVFRELEFRGLIDRLNLEAKAGVDASAAAAPPAAPVEVSVVASAEELARLGDSLRHGFALQVVPGAGHPVEGRISAIALAPLAGSGETVTIVSLTEPEADLFAPRGLSAAEAVRVLRPLLEDAAVAKVGYNLKPGLLALRRHGCELRGLVHDAAIAAYLLDPTRATYRLEDLGREYLGAELPAELHGDTTALAARTAALVKLQPLLERRLADNGLAELFRTMETPLLGVLAAMEYEGVAIDRQRLLKMGDEFAARLVELTADIYRLAGGEFNINSTKQLGEILFVKLGLPAVKKTKTGFSTDAEVLEALAANHEIAAKLLEHRALSKLKSTYVDGLAALVSPLTGRVHTTFQQTVTATGRLSSTEPNLQNIPIRDELGRRLRLVFVPDSPDKLILAADYSQIELRILAHLSGDAYMTDSFLRNQDVHQRTAAEVFGVRLEDVTRDMRARAKAVNFGIVYGISDFGLARQLGIPRAEAAQYIATYFERYGGVKDYMDRTISQARAQGYVTTLFGRRRLLPDIDNRNRNVRQFAERTAINTPIQGTAADIIKLAMISIDRRLRAEKLRSKMILQVHDELIFEVERDELDAMKRLVRDEMEGVVKMSVPLLVDVKVGPNWYDVKGIAVD